jgi:Fe-S cluster assembly scaffold protein SufB
VALGAEARGAGLVLESFADWAHRDLAGFRHAITVGTALPADDKLAALTRALWTTGVHVALPKGARLTDPIVVRWTVAGGTALVGRTIVELGDDTELRLIEELTSGDDAERPALLAGTTEARLGSGANLSVASLQELSDRHVAFQHRTGSIGNGANLHWALAQLGSRLVRSRVDNRLEGDGSSVEQVEIVFGSQDQLFDLTSYTRHVGRDATSNLLSKAVLQDSSRTFLKGLVTIDKSGSGTDSFLGEYGMNLSKKARAVAIPSLEIDQPDCRRVAHSSSVGPIDESQLFYLESRGIPPDDARKFIVLGFLEPVVARVPLASAQDRLREALEAKWDEAHGSSAAA